jgi:arsenate reductase-like glutaredoxin family protein
VQVDARKTTLKEKEALALVQDVDEIYASKGKQVVHLDLKKDKPDKAALLGLLLGPTGNLRAPTLRQGRTLLVGFDETAYARVLK